MVSVAHCSLRHPGLFGFDDTTLRTEAKEYELGEGGIVSAEETSVGADTQGQLAIVLTGGAARAGYQAGVLRGLARRLPELRFPIITGVSAGAINAAFLAAHPGSFREAADELCGVWDHIQFEDVFRADLGILLRNAVRWIARLGLGGSKLSPQVRGLVDTAPLRGLLQRGLRASGGEIEGIAHNIEAGRLEGVALLTVNYGTGQTVTWFQGRDIEIWKQPNRVAVPTRLTVEHVMASSAIPMLFPAIELDGAWFGDGGIRHAAPLSPALHLGADRVLTISTRYARTPEEEATSAVNGYPPPVQIAGNLFNAVFLDVLDQDILRLQRLNSLLSSLPPEQRQGLNPVAIEVLRPSMDLGRLAAEFEPRLPKAFRFFTRGLGTRETRSPDALSLLMFQPDYLDRLIELGEADAEANWRRVEALAKEDRT